MARRGPGPLRRICGDRDLACRTDHGLVRRGGPPVRLRRTRDRRQAVRDAVRGLRDRQAPAAGGARAGASGRALRGRPLARAPERHALLEQRRGQPAPRRAAAAHRLREDPARSHRSAHPLRSAAKPFAAPHAAGVQRAGGVDDAGARTAQPAGADRQRRAHRGFGGQRRREGAHDERDRAPDRGDPAPARRGRPARDAARRAAAVAHHRAAGCLEHGGRCAGAGSARQGPGTGHGGSAEKRWRSRSTRRDCSRWC